MTNRGLTQGDGHCSLCHALNDIYNDDGLADGCCCCKVHKEHGGSFPPIDSERRA